MTRKGYPLWGLSITGALALILILSNGVQAASTEYKALIVVSNYDGTDENELDKAVAFYEHLVDSGFAEEDIIFLEKRIDSMGRMPTTRYALVG